MDRKWTTNHFRLLIQETRRRQSVDERKPTVAYDVPDSAP